MPSRKIVHVTDAGDGFESEDELQVIAYEKAWEEMPLIDKYIADLGTEMTDVGVTKKRNSIFKFMMFWKYQEVLAEKNTPEENSVARAQANLAAAQADFALSKTKSVLEDDTEGSANDAGDSTDSGDGTSSQEAAV